MRFTGWLVVGAFFVDCSGPRERPNVVVILVDDLGWNDLGYSGSTFYETPNIDDLSTESLRFTQAYSSGSVCSPSRAAFLTGLHPARLNITDWIPGADPRDRSMVGPQDLDELPLDHVTLAEALRDRGYRTMFAGKWHLGDEGHFPEDQGFERNVGGHHRGSPPGGYYTPYKNPKLPDGPPGEYLTDRLTTEAMDFIRTAKKEPFLVFLSFYTVHTPIQAHLGYVEHFMQTSQSLDLPDTLYRVEGGGSTTMAQHQADYASMVYAMDVNVGRIIQQLKASGLYDQTTVIFTSDNGGLSTLDTTRANHGPTSVWPLRGGKGWLYEGGIRVPLLIKPAHWSGQGMIIDEPVIGHDLFPTILSMTGPGSSPYEPLDGVDLTPLYVGDSIAREAIWWHYPHYHGSAWTPGAAIRSGDWKLIEFYESGHVELYDLSTDRSEQVDLSSQFPDRTRQLLEELHRQQRSANANAAVANQ